MRDVRKVFIIISMCLLCICLTACGRKTKDADIEQYLQQAYFEARNLILEEVKEVTEQPGELANTVLVTCTTKASNEYVEQTAKWELLFEKFDGNMVGSKYEMRQNDYTLLSVLSEETVADEMADRFYNWIFFQITDVEENLNTGTVKYYYSVYDNHKAFYIKWDYVIEYKWNKYTMSWESGNDERLSDDELGLKVDLTGEYEYTKDHPGVWRSNENHYEKIKIEQVDANGKIRLSAYEYRIDGELVCDLEGLEEQEVQIEYCDPWSSEYRLSGWGGKARAYFYKKHHNSVNIYIEGDELKLSSTASMGDEVTLKKLDCKNIYEFLNPEYAIYEGKCE